MITPPHLNFQSLKWRLEGWGEGWGSKGIFWSYSIHNFKATGIGDFRDEHKMAVFFYRQLNTICKADLFSGIVKKQSKTH